MAWTRKKAECVTTKNIGAAGGGRSASPTASTGERTLAESAVIHQGRRKRAALCRQYRYTSRKLILKKNSWKT